MTIYDMYVILMHHNVKIVIICEDHENKIIPLVTMWNIS